MSIHRRNKLWGVGLLILFLAAVPQRAARADTAPKPTMEFKFTFVISPAPSIVSGIQEECNHADCSDARPLQEGAHSVFPAPRRIVLRGRIHTPNITGCVSNSPTV